MKKTLFAIAAVSLLAGASAFAQGQLLFNNLSGLASVTLAGNPGQYAGSQFSVGFYWQAGVVAGPVDSFIASGTFYNPGVTMFGDGSLFEPDQNDGAGFFDAGATLTVPGTAAGTYTLSVVAWSGGSTYANASGYTGASSLFQINLVTSPTPANNIAGLQPFTVAPVPEPSTFALAGLGLASLLIFRRRK
jgi:hypothetical protein